MTEDDASVPVFAVETVNTTDRAEDIRDKREIYVEAGILYWEVYAKRRLFDIYEPGKPPRTLGMDDTLDGGSVLPGFTLPVKNLFPH